VGTGDQAWPPREGEQDPLHQGDLPPLAAREGAPDHGPARVGAQGRGDEDHARAEVDPRRSAHALQGLRRHWRQQRPHQARSQVRQGGGHGHPRHHRPHQALGRADQEALLGEQDRPAAHRALQGHRQVRLRHRAHDDRAQGVRHHGRPRAQ
jgi:hypothetical protein